jgi:hypothetical protein
MAADSTDPPSESSSAGIDSPAFSQSREFWLVLAYAVGLGVLGAFIGLIFLGVIDLGGEWYDDADPDWFGGELWWVAVTAGAGLVVGVLHRFTRLPQDTPGLIADLRTEHVEAKHVPGIVAVSAASLMGGASFGPEKALGSAIGGAGGWLSERRGLGEDLQKTNTVAELSELETAESLVRASGEAVHPFVTTQPWLASPRLPSESRGSAKWSRSSSPIAVARSTSVSPALLPVCRSVKASSGSRRPAPSAGCAPTARSTSTPILRHVSRTVTASL